MHRQPRTAAHRNPVQDGNYRLPISPNEVIELVFFFEKISPRLEGDAVVDDGYERVRIASQEPWLPTTSPPAQKAGVLVLELSDLRMTNLQLGLSSQVYRLVTRPPQALYFESFCDSLHHARVDGVKGRRSVELHNTKRSFRVKVYMFALQE